MNNEKPGLKCPPVLLPSEPIGLVARLKDSVNQEAVDVLTSQGIDIEKLNRRLAIVEHSE